MTNKFKVGDSVKPIEDLSLYGFPLDEVVPVVNIYGNHSTIRVRNAAGLEETFFVERFELVSRKQTESQRRATLEETVAKLGEEISELKLIVAQIRKPSTVVQEAIDKAEWQRGEVEGVIEFEGKRYKKVDREAREGDVVVFRDTPSGAVNNEKPYLAITANITGQKELCVSGGLFGGVKCFVYDKNYSRTPETVDVYELIVEDKPALKFGIRNVKIITPNQLRAEIIEKAKVFVGKATRYGLVDGEGGIGDLVGSLYDEFYVVEFHKKQQKITAIVTISHRNGKKKVFKPTRVGRAKCAPGDVFNEHIGKAIALGRALGLDVSEFEQAVQPTEFVVGQQVYYESEYGRNFSGLRTISGFNSEGNPLSKEKSGYMDERKLTIINDTNAIYGGVE